MGNHPILTRWAQCNHKVIIRGHKEGQRQREGRCYDEIRSQREIPREGEEERFEDTILLVLEMEEGANQLRNGVLEKLEKEKEVDFPLKPPERTQSCQDLEEF